MVAHTFSPTQEAEAAESLSSRLAWFTEFQDSVTQGNKTKNKIIGTYVSIYTCKGSYFSLIQERIFQNCRVLKRGLVPKSIIPVLRKESKKIILKVSLSYTESSKSARTTRNLISKNKTD